jgi:hypothetical protein
MNFTDLNEKLSQTLRYSEQLGCYRAARCRFLVIGRLILAQLAQKGRRKEKILVS